MLQWLKLNWSPFDFILLVCFAIFLLVTEYRLIWQNGKGKKRQSEDLKVRKLGVKDIPGPWPRLPILGTRWIFSKMGPYKMDSVHEAYCELYKQYGDVFREEALWNYPVISVVDSSAIEKIFKQSSRYPLRPPTELTVHYRQSRPDRYTNMGLVNEQGETWHHLRMLLTPELTNAKTINRFLPEHNTITDDFISLLRTLRDSSNNVFKFEELAGRLGLELSCSLTLGRRMGFLNEEVDPIASKLASAVKTHFCTSRDTFYGLPFWKVFPSQTYDDFVQSEETIYDIVSELVEESLVEESKTCNLNGVQSVFMSILQAEGLDVRDKKAAIIDFIAAGIQTLGNSLVFLLYLIAKRPDVQERLRDELREAMTKGGDLSLEELKKATYLRACIHEAFRVLPAATCVARILETELQVGKYHLQPGTVVLCQTWLACLEESNFECAKEFRPERWLTNIGRSSPFLVVPFGYGRRMCPGKRFIEQELHVILAKLVTEFKLEFDGDLDLQFEFLLGPKAPVTLRLIDL